jgi:hypothetical protein
MRCSSRPRSRAAICGGSSRRPDRSASSTVLSRCVVARIPAASREERLAAAREQGLSSEAAEDFAAFAAGRDRLDDEERERLRELRAELVAAIEASLERRHLVPLLLLADRLGRADTSDSRLLAELLADAAVAAMGGGEVVRHRGVGGATSEIGRRLPFDAIAAPRKAADAPPDTRRGNRRLHFEQLLIQLYLSAG